MEIILRFSVALAADIEKAFLMIGITPQDKDVLRFLWIDDIKSMVPKIEVFRFTRVASVLSVIKPIPPQCHHKTSRGEVF